jgi:SAM-dependent methyltransferase
MTSSPAAAAQQPASNPGGLSLADIIRLNDLFHDSALLHLAVGTALFDRLTEPKSAADIAAEMHWVERKSRILLDALSAIGLLTKEDNHYVNTQSTTHFLATSGDFYLGAIIDHQRLQWQLWSRMDDVLASENPVEAQQELRLRKDRTANTAFNRAMVQLSRDNVADVLALSDFAGAKRVLDLCGGHGTYLAALARNHPQLTGEVWDLENTRELAEQTFADYEVADRLSFRVQDVLEPDAFAGQRADACMLNDCLHYFDRSETTSLIGNAASVLQPGGLLVVLTMTLEDDGVTPAPAAGFSLHMMLNTNHGELHPTSWIRRVMQDASLEVESLPLGSLGRYTVLAGRKTAD